MFQAQLKISFISKTFKLFYVHDKRTSDIQKIVALTNL